MKKILFLLLTLIFVSACDVQQSEPEIPNKPSEVPDKAFWVGGESSFKIRAPSRCGPSPEACWGEGCDHSG